MNLTNALLIGLKEIWAHKFRSLLTMLGIVLGVASLVAMAAIVKGMENGMKESLIAMGGVDKVWIRDEDVPAHQEHLRDEAPGKTMLDVHALQASAPLIRLVSPELELRPSVVTRAGKEADTSEVLGVWPTVLEVNLLEVEHGRFFTDLDEELASSVCVIGTGIRDQLFGSPEETGQEIIPIGETLTLNGQAFTIVGMFQHYESEQTRLMKERERRQPKTAEASGPKRMKGFRSPRWDAFWRKNNNVFIPLNTMWVKFRSGSTTNGLPDPTLSDIDIKVREVGQMDAALQQARNVLLLNRNGVENFAFRTQENDVVEIDKRIRNARMSGGIIAGLSLLVGGIGIMNIMLASINERIREIGTCLALGATSLAIFVQIVVESITIALLGAMAGLGASYGLVQVILAASPAQNAPVITSFSMIVAVAFSAMVGLMAGLFPAWKASRLNPIQALRYE